MIRRTERSIVGVMCGVQLKHRKRARDFLLMLGLNETINEFIVANNVPWYRHLLRMVDSPILRRASVFHVEG